MEQDDAFGTNMGYCEEVDAFRDGAFNEVPVVTHICRMLTWPTS